MTFNKKIKELDAVSRERDLAAMSVVFTVELMLPGFDERAKAKLEPLIKDFRDKYKQSHELTLKLTTND